jgi:protein-tyrosine phosphatase
VIDLHSHILRGIDDGARNLEESLEIARAAVSDGITVMACTPHVRDDWPTDASVMEYRLFELAGELRQAGIPLQLRPGGEIALEWLARLAVGDLRRFGLGGNRRYLLVETPYYGWPLGFGDALFQLYSQGIVPVIAHPERNAEVQANPARLIQLIEGGALVQVTAASLDGRIGRRAQECARELIDEELCHLLASDAHHASIRAVGMAAAAQAVGDEALARWLTLEVPQAILEDTELPPRPRRSSGGKGWLTRVLGG